MFSVFKNGIEGNYSISRNPSFVNNSCWVVYPAKHKTTKKSYSVWQFNKKDWEQKLMNEGVINKSNKKLILNDIYENINKFISNQSKFKHPNFLTIIEPLEDHKHRILFVTEYVINDLFNFNKEEIDEIMITKGLLQVSNGIKFLHESVNSVHLNLNPSSILITENFDWKINNLTFIENLNNGIIEKYIDPIDSRLPTFLSIDFRFTSPNLLIKHKVDFIDDLFSICCIIYYLFNNGNFIINCNQCSNISDYERNINKLNQILTSISNINYNHEFFKKIPENYYSVFINFLKNTQESNTDVIQLNKILTIDDLINSNIFNNELIKLLNIIDEFPTLLINDKINFLKNLKLEIEKFPKLLLINKFIPILIECIDLNQFKKNNQPDPEYQELIIESLDNLIILSKNLSQLTFTDKIFPFLLILMKKAQFDGFKILMLKNLNIIQKCLSNNESFQKLSIDLFNKCIDEKNNSMIVQELTLNNLKIISESQTYSTISTIILPKICLIYSTTTSLKIKNLTITIFIILISQLENKNLDDYLIVDKILPLIYNTSTTNYSNSKFTNNMLLLYNQIFIKLSTSSTKSFNIKNEEMEVYDIIINIGMNIWKIAKYINNPQDLNNFTNNWKNIENYLKNDLNNRISNNSNFIQPPVSNTVKIEETKSVESFKPIIPQRAISSSPKNDFKFGQTTTMSQNNNVVKSQWETLTPTTKNSRTDPINSMHSATVSPKPSVPVKQNNSGIDWSNAGNHSVMKPTSVKNSTNTLGNNTIANNSNKNSNNNWDSFGIMKPTSVGTGLSVAKPVEVVVDKEEDAWGDFAVGSTTTKTVNRDDNQWGSLI